MLPKLRNFTLQFTLPKMNENVSTMVQIVSFSKLIKKIVDFKKVSERATRQSERGLAHASGGVVPRGRVGNCANSTIY